MCAKHKSERSVPSGLALQGPFLIFYNAFDRVSPIVINGPAPGNILSYPHAHLNINATR